MTSLGHGPTLCLAEGVRRRPCAAPHPSPHWTVRDVMKKSGSLTESGRFTHVMLHEPAKDAVLNWRPGQRLPRRAFVVIADQGVPHEAIVDLDSKTLLRGFRDVRRFPLSQYGMTPSAACQQYELTSR